MKIKIKLERDGVLPEKMTTGSTYDCYVREIDYNRDGRIIHYLGFATELPPNIRGYLYARSSICKYPGLYFPGGLGYIDSDYRGEYMFVLRNNLNLLSPYRKGDRCCQLEFREYLNIEWDVVDELNETDRKGGFGSTDEKV